MLQDYATGGRLPSFVYPSAVDNFKRQFMFLEGQLPPQQASASFGGAIEPQPARSSASGGSAAARHGVAASGRPIAGASSLPRERAADFRAEAAKYSRALPDGSAAPLPSSCGGSMAMAAAAPAARAAQAHAPAAAAAAGHGAARAHVSVSAYNLHAAAAACGAGGCGGGTLCGAPQPVVAAADPIHYKLSGSAPAGAAAPAGPCAAAPASPCGGGGAANGTAGANGGGGGGLPFALGGPLFQCNPILRSSSYQPAPIPR